MVIRNGNNVTGNGHRVYSSTNATVNASMDPHLVSNLQESLTHSFNCTSLKLPTYEPMHVLDTRQYRPVAVYSSMGGLKFLIVLCAVGFVLKYVRDSKEVERTQWRISKNGELIPPQV